MGPLSVNGGQSIPLQSRSALKVAKKVKAASCYSSKSQQKKQDEMGAIADEQELRWWRKKRQRRRGVQAEAWRNAGPEVNIFRSKPGSTTHHSSMKYGLNYHDSIQIRVEQPRRQYELSIHLRRWGCEIGEENARSVSHIAVVM
ncbi:hypothetical protein RHSIM_Rhsim05G0115800 [Rhododendron simsii]|uniref:Uncharacterized protein n=1 Tax=Rhododendron simsii TaxID=118357 RepID=A0A834H2A2_RHOSS|nr:hypothetical protein RHSIM_Rhsim05G0115800 [Rhododendron simsii]